MRFVARVVSFASVAVLSTVALAQDGIRTERAQFAPGATSAVIDGAVTGNEVVDHVLTAAAGQTMHVLLYTDSPSANFNVLPPNPEFEGQAIFMGANEGNEFSAVLDESGDFSIRVYLLGAAADEGQTVDYQVEVSVTGNAIAAQAPADGGAAQDPFEMAVEMGDRYGASTVMDCSFGAPTYDSLCPAGITRHAGDGATIYISRPDGTLQVVEYTGSEFQAYDSNVEWLRDAEDMWLLNINDREFYRFADVFLIGDAVETPEGVAAAEAGAVPDDVEVINVRFAQGATSATLTDSIIGYWSIEYRLEVSAGQTIHVDLSSDNGQNYFNVFAPGAFPARTPRSISARRPATASSGWPTPRVPTQSRST